MLVTADPIPSAYYNIGGSYICEVGDTLQTLIDMSTAKDKIKVCVDPERMRLINTDL